MENNRQNKKMLLFLGDENPVWRRLQALERALGRKLHHAVDLQAAATRDAPAGANDRHARERADPRPPSPKWCLLDRTDTTIEAWCRGEIGRRHGFERALTGLADRLGALARRDPALPATTPADAQLPPGVSVAQEAAALQALLREYLRDWSLGDDGMKVYQTAGLILGIEEARAQRALDRFFYANRPLLPHMYFDTEADAEEAFDVVGGLYVGWMCRQGRWMRCALHVRYVLGQGGQYFIRAKLNLPAFYRGAADPSLTRGGAGSATYWEYDGAVRVSNRTLFWIFDKRSTSRHDYFFIATGARESLAAGAQPVDKAFSGFTGQYLTSHQDDHQSIVGGSFVLQAASANGVAEMPGTDSASIFMWTTPTVLEAADDGARWPSRLFDRLGMAAESSFRAAPR